MNRDNRRIRTMTDKGEELFLKGAEQRRKQSEDEWNLIEDIILTANELSADSDLNEIRQIDCDLRVHYQSYSSKNEEYLAYLSRNGSDTANSMKEEFKENLDQCVSLVHSTLRNIKSLKLNLMERITETSVLSTASQKRLKAEAEKARLAIKEKEASLLKQKADIDASLLLVKQEEKVIDAEAEARIEENIEFGLERSNINLPVISKSELVGEYIDTLTSQSDQKFTSVSEGANVTKRTDYALPPPNLASAPHYDNYLSHASVTMPYTYPYSGTSANHVASSANATKYNPYASAFHPSVPWFSSSLPQSTHGISFSPNPTYVYQSPTTQRSAANLNLTNMSELTKFMFRKEFMLKNIEKFKDTSESYPAWRDSFKSIIQDMQMTPREEIDFLISSLGPYSSKSARTLKVANTHDPAAGLKRIWEMLHERYGRPETEHQTLKLQLKKLPVISTKDYFRLYQYVDVLTEVESAMQNPMFKNLLNYFDSSEGVRPILEKLPDSINNKWMALATKYKRGNDVLHPPFTFFVRFIRDTCSMRNDPAFKRTNLGNSASENNRGNGYQHQRQQVTTRKADIASKDIVDCPVHHMPHSIHECRAFRRRTLQDRRQFLRGKGICARCCVSSEHIPKDCTVKLKCSFCNSEYHTSAMHVGKVRQVSGKESTTDGDNKFDESTDPKAVVQTKCTTLCGGTFSGRSCGKVVLVEVFHIDFPDKSVRTYAVVDDQSNKTLASSAVFNDLGISSPSIEYTMTSCAGSLRMAGRTATGLCVKSCDGTVSLCLPDVIECDAIPSDLAEVPTMDVALAHQHLNRIADFIPPLETDLCVQLLIGRDTPEVHLVKDQIIGPPGAPFAQHLSLGWVIIGNVCLGQVHPPNTVSVRKTHILPNGRGTTFDPCGMNIYVEDTIGSEIFIRRPDDNKIGLSVEDKQFLEIMDREFHVDETGHWSAPLPFKLHRPKLPDNRPQAWKRAQILHSSLKKGDVKREHFMAFMAKVLGSGAAEKAPTDKSEESWYLPLFGIYHPKKPEQIRGVFDSSASYEGVSLNSVLMTGPDLTNNLLGVLLRFHKDTVAVTGDIEQMFYQFHVNKEHRDYLRFFWYDQNDFTKPLTMYRMKSHVFGNSPSPSVATYGLRRAVADEDQDIRDFIRNDFYVDDCLTSRPTDTEVIELISKTQTALRNNASIRLHKISSNSVNVLRAFPQSELGKGLKDLNLTSDYLPVQHSLGLQWDLSSDTFFFSVISDDKPLTRRGLLSTINSLYDPLGFLAPLTITGRMILREVVPPGADWDDPLSEDHVYRWTSWLESLHSICDIRIPRMVVPVSVSLAESTEVHICSDASELAIAAVAYRTFDQNGLSSLGFLIGKSKLAPRKGNTIPRLELCAAVLAAEVGQIIATHLDICPESFHYYTDSKVVLGYICNTTRRFFTYVSNRVEKIHKVSKPSQWHYIATDINPADTATRPSLSSSTSKIQKWMQPPKFPDVSGSDDTPNDFTLISPESDKEIRSEIVCNKVNVCTKGLGSARFSRFYTLAALLRGVMTLRKFISERVQSRTIDTSKEGAMQFIIKCVQQDVYSTEIENLRKMKNLPKCSSILSLSPFLDENDILRIGGRLQKSNMDLLEKQPVILPGKHDVSVLVVKHFHNSVKHQGRHITEGAIRSAGFWFTGCKSLVNRVISDCVVCRRLRGVFMSQKMAALPKERLQACPPFTYVGLDCFGPWNIVTRKTRGGSASSKRWAVIFCCLSCRAVHIEVLEEMSTSSFINALRRFLSIRGPVKEYFSDRGSNFVGSTHELDIPAINVEDPILSRFLDETNSVWKFNPPYASHFGGVWERLIGLTRRILDAILYESRHQKLTHEVLCTFMAETTAIINSRPIAPIGTDPEFPFILSPKALLTQKTVSQAENFSHIDTRDVYKSQWKFVQVLANRFWARWRKEYLQSLQPRRKWPEDKQNLKVGDLVLVKDNDCPRNLWPTALVERVFASDDQLVRKVELRTVKEGKVHMYIRPLKEVILLSSSV